MSNRSARARRRAAKVRNQRIALVAIFLLVIAVVAYFAFFRGTTTQTQAECTPGSEEMVTTDSGLQYQDILVCSGPEAAYGDAVAVHYTGWLEDGTKFDSSLDRGTPFEFTVGTGMVIPGWDEGVTGMTLGGKRKLIIPPDLAYGSSGAGGVIPPDATLIFEVELVEFQ